MNKKLFILALALVGVSAFSFQTKAEESAKGISLEVGADIVSSYLWRGMNLGGISIQPSVTLDWKGLYVSGWANIGADNWTFEDINPELDITIGYDNYGLQVDLTHLYYFGGDAYFPRNGFKAQPHLSPDSCGSTMEAHAGFHLGDLVEDVPLTIDWYTTIYGADCYQDENDEWKRAWSTYIELGYDFDLGEDWILAARVGMTPAKSLYTGFKGNFAVMLAGTKLTKSWSLACGTVSAFAHVMLQPWNVNKNNLILPITAARGQKLSLAVGCSYEI